MIRHRVHRKETTQTAAVSGTQLTECFSSSSLTHIFLSFFFFFSNNDHIFSTRTMTHQSRMLILSVYDYDFCTVEGAYNPLINASNGFSRGFFFSPYFLGKLCIWRGRWPLLLFIHSIKLESMHRAFGYRYSYFGVI